MVVGWWRRLEWQLIRTSPSSIIRTWLLNDLQRNLEINSLQKSRFADKTPELWLPPLRTLILIRRRRWRRSFWRTGSHAWRVALPAILFFSINGWKARGKWHSLNTAARSLSCDIRERRKTTYNFWRKLLKWSPTTPVATRSIIAAWNEKTENWLLLSGEVKS